ncbi:AHH domain-containing protein [Moritella viscosa]|uniref:Uncharacterized protein n=1 Tax=Moritella viscosa TaxID=80854 RepID=A0A1L0C5C3_9GAMM|nr:AHH domain-containing protein [Moritella viscosa]SGZ15766.1 Putative uncharacterized protein [Moritella viscosa]SHO11033.1 Putative uncharacterized protein [Moritella viscosa]SHO11039.1 Putative uncharacterized protein [Moritella viscosa]SHO17460.1 Putative uncharacterized protein [Moritella viscosa]SHO17753.1 Putative uncharacterized protein [Moritella viscosa]
MAIQKNKGRWKRSSLSKIKTKRENHPLNFQAKAIAAHHLISCDVAAKLSSTRKKQIVYKGYDINYPFNLVFLPMMDQSACHYEVPLHKSGHTDRKIEEFYSEKKGSTIDSDISELEANLHKETDKDKSTILQDDINMVSHLKGYHRVVGSMLAKVLKNLDCDDNKDDFVDTLDELSIEIAAEIGRFKLHLISRGRHMESNQKGCSYCRKANARHDHYSVLSNTKILPKDAIKRYCYTGVRLYTVQEHI